MVEQFFQCPYCGEEISMFLDPSVLDQSYIEDCEVCCQPIQVSTVFEEEGKLSSFSATTLDQ